MPIPSIAELINEHGSLRKVLQSMWDDYNAARDVLKEITQVNHTWAAPNIAVNTGATTQIAVAGLAEGDYVVVSPKFDPEYLMISAVARPGEIRLSVFNPSNAGKSYGNGPLEFNFYIIKGATSPPIGKTIPALTITK